MIKNLEALSSRGNVGGRKVVLEILETGLKAPDSYPNVRKMLRIENGKLFIGHPDFFQQIVDKPALPLVFNLKDVKNIYVVGGGKAVQRQAEAVEDVLGDRITDSQLQLKKGEEVRLKKIKVTLAGHPIPDEDSVKGAQRILDIERKAKEGDIVFFCTSGGGTALKALPAPGISLVDLQKVYRILYFGCGASMPESNAVRNLLTLVRGKHAKNVKGATVIELSTPEQPPVFRVHVFRTPTHLEAYDAAIGVLKDYQCWDKIPEAVRGYLEKRDPRFLPPTPEEWRQRPYYRFRVMGPEYMIEAARKKSEEMGLNTTVLATTLNDVAARDLGGMLASIAEEVEVLGRPLKPPCVFISGGEAVVAIGDETGVGGRNQELCLAAAMRIEGSKNTVIGSVDSDGTDGPTDAAGAIVDGETMGRIRKAGFNLNQELSHHNSFPVLNALDDIIYTGRTSTNVRDLRVVYVGGRLA